MKLERWQGLPHMNSKMKLCCPVFSLFVFSVYSVTKTQTAVYQVGLVKKQTVNEHLYLLIDMSSPKLHTAPLGFMF